MPAAVAPAANHAAARTDLEQLQGVWAAVGGPREARLLIAGHRFTFEFVGGDLYMGTFDLTPGRMDMHVEEGPAKHIGLYSRCIYQIEDGVLRFCAGRPGSLHRPDSFDVDDRTATPFVFRRTARPARR